VGVDLVFDDQLYRGVTENLAEGGVFVATPAVRGIGTAVMVKFALPETADLIWAQAEVRWIRRRSAANDGAAAGMGLKFVKIAGETVVAIQRHLRASDPACA
jgi:uncharacterized protein (TIGR02266 family)